jgi:hypothetical protein
LPLGPSDLRSTFASGQGGLVRGCAHNIDREVCDLSGTSFLAKCDRAYPGSEQMAPHQQGALATYSLSPLLAASSLLSSDSEPELERDSVLLLDMYSVAVTWSLSFSYGDIAASEGELMALRSEIIERPSGDLTAPLCIVVSALH